MLSLALFLALNLIPEGPGDAAPFVSFRADIFQLFSSKHSYKVAIDPWPTFWHILHISPEYS